MRNNYHLNESVDDFSRQIVFYETNRESDIELLWISMATKTF